MSRTWIRVEDEFGQYDHDKSRPLRDGVSVVKDYPEHVGDWARPVKPRTTKSGKPTAKRRAPRSRAPKSATTAKTEAATQADAEGDTTAE